MLESCVLLLAFFGALLFVAGQKSLYLDLLRGLKEPSVRAGAGTTLAAADGGHSGSEAAR
jgi:hypothetical protein